MIRLILEIPSFMVMTLVLYVRFKVGHLMSRTQILKVDSMESLILIVAHFFVILMEMISPWLKTHQAFQLVNLDLIWVR